MKLTIKGPITEEKISDAFKAALKKIGIFENPEYEARGATLYFNIYEKATGAQVDFRNESEEVDHLVFKEKKKVKTIGIDEGKSE